jgi:hypothetical protein
VADRRHLPLELTIVVRLVRKMAPLCLNRRRHRPPLRSSRLVTTRATMATPTPKRKGKEKEGVASAPDRTTAGRTADNHNINYRRLKHNKQTFLIQRPSNNNKKKNLYFIFFLNFKFFALKT